jgi:HlyD family secretion protein
VRRILVIALVLAALAAVAAFAYARYVAAHRAVDRLVLYGNVDIREIDLAANVEGPLQKVLVEEGDKVRQGQLLAVVEPDIYRHAVALATARVEAQRAVVARLTTGSRPEEVEQARAEVAADQAALVRAQADFERRQQLLRAGNVSQQAYDEAQAQKDEAVARLAASRQALALAEQGPRLEDREQAAAQLRGEEATLELARYRLARTQVVAPADATVLARVVEPGTILMPTTVIFTLALDDRVWVRTYVPEPDLGRLRPGMAVTIATDSRPDRPYDGYIGFISPTAEFTPKTVETPELRTQLVYRLRVFVRNPDAGLRQGMPVTITVPLGP